MSGTPPFPYVPRAADVQSVHALTKQGAAALDAGRVEEALACFQRAVDLAPDAPESTANLALALLRAERPRVAQSLLQSLVLRHPHHAPAWHLLGNACMALGEPQAACDHYTRARAEQPQWPDPLRNRGVARLRAHDLEGARTDTLAALDLDPQHIPTWCNLGLIERERGALPASLQAYDRALALDPEHAGAHTDKAHTLLLMAQWESGWAAYAWRWRHSTLQLPAPLAALPTWNGRPLTSSDTLLVHSEQGLGDTLQFCRFVPLLARSGARVVLAVPASMVALLAQNVAGLATVCDIQMPLPPADLRCGLLDLPRLLGPAAAPETGAAGYLRVRRGAQAQQPRRGAGEPLRVGLVWRGSPRHSDDARRSIPLDALLASLPLGPQYTVLQRDLTAAEHALLAQRADLVQPLLDGSDWLATARCVQALDLLVSVDTSVAHLGGALGVPTWIVLPHAPDWRWQLQRSDSPWYDSVRLLRQTRSGDWSGPLATLAHDLQARHAPTPAIPAVQLPAPESPCLQPEDLVCPVCAHPADVLDVLDFNASCERARGRHFALCTIPIYYVHCRHCGFVGAPQMRRWTAAQWRERVYNADYAQVDPDFAQQRPAANARQLLNWIGPHAAGLRHLDYGGGNGVLSQQLGAAGWHSQSWDPLHNQPLPSGPFDLITAFEVFEHASDPHGVMAALRTCLAESGVVLLSTLLSDGQLPQPGERLSWWYAAPRNGHISLHSAASLQHLARHHGLHCTHLSAHWHALHTTVPVWAQPWLRPGAQAGVTA